MNTRPRLKGLLLAVGLLTGVRAAWAGDSIKAVDRCQELAIGEYVDARDVAVAVVCTDSNRNGLVYAIAIHRGREVDARRVSIR